MMNICSTLIYHMIKLNSRKTSQKAPFRHYYSLIFALYIKYSFNFYRYKTNFTSCLSRAIVKSQDKRHRGKSLLAENRHQRRLKRFTRFTGTGFLFQHKTANSSPFFKCNIRSAKAFQKACPCETLTAFSFPGSGVSGTLCKRLWR